MQNILKLQIQYVHIETVKEIDKKKLFNKYFSQEFKEIIKKSIFVSTKKKKNYKKLYYDE